MSLLTNVLKFLLYNGPLVTLQSWIVTLLWKWYVTPTFNLPEIGILTVVGIGLIITVFDRDNKAKVKIKGFSSDYDPTHENHIEELFESFLGVGTKLFLTLFLGWFLHIIF